MPGQAASHLFPIVMRVLERIRAAGPPVCPGRSLPAGPPTVTFYPYVDTKSTVRERDGRLHLRLSDHLRGAPEPVLEGVVWVLLCRLYGIPQHHADPAAVAAYRAFVASQGVADRRRASRRERGRKHVDPIGDHRSLLESYLRVVMDMDLDVPETPRLSWSKTVSRRRMGHWDPDHGCIVISRVLDDPDVPEWVLDYVVYHEVLHILHPVQQGRGRRRVHTSAFKRAEARFPRRSEAEQWLSALAAGRKRPRMRA